MPSRSPSASRTSVAAAVRVEMDARRPPAGSPRSPAARDRAGSRWRTGAARSPRPSSRASTSRATCPRRRAPRRPAHPPEPSHRAPIVTTAVTAIEVRAKFDFRLAPRYRFAMSAELLRQLRRVEAQAERGHSTAAPAERERRRRLAARAAAPAPRLQRGLPPRRPPGRRLGPAVGPGLRRLHGRLPRHALSAGGGRRQARGRTPPRWCWWRSAATGAASSIRCPISTSW